MTGKYGEGGKSVSVSSAIEEALVERFFKGETYDGKRDVEFYAFQNGIVIDVPVTGGGSDKHVMAFSRGLVDHGVDQFLIDLKEIFGGEEVREGSRHTKVEELAAP